MCEMFRPTIFHLALVVGNVCNERPGRHAGAPVDAEVVQANGPVLPVGDRAAHHRALIRPAQDVQQTGSFADTQNENSTSTCFY